MFFLRPFLGTTSGYILNIKRKSVEMYSGIFTFDVVKTIVPLRFLRAAPGSESIWKLQALFGGSVTLLCNHLLLFE